MAQHPTSLKLPMDLKERIDRLAREGDETPHALMIRALQTAVTAMELRSAFIQDALEADRRMVETGIGYAAEDVARYLRAKAAGKKARKPRPIQWRK
jgi:predicted transcriptional regulator